MLGSEAPFSEFIVTCVLRNVLTNFPLRELALQVFGGSSEITLPIR